MTARHIAWTLALVLSETGYGQDTAPPLPETPVTLQEATDLALAHNPRIAAAESRVSAAAELVGAARGALGVHLDTSADARQYDWLPPNKERTLGPGTRDIVMSVDVSKLLYAGGLVHARVSAARADHAFSSQQLRRARQQVAFDTTKAFYDVLRNQAAHRADQQAVEQLTRHWETTRGMLRVGKVPELDVLQAEVELAYARQRQVATANSIDLALLRLRNAMGLPQDFELALSAPPEAELGRRAEIPPEGELLSRALAERPEAIATELQIARTRAERREASSALKPQVRAIGNYYREGTSLDLGSSNWFMGMRFDIPLYDGGITRHAVHAAEARTQAAEAERETVRQEISLDVRDAALSAREAWQRITATQAAVEQARRAFQIEQRKYQVGAGRSLDVLDAQTALTRAEHNYLDAIYDYQTALARIRWAVGEDPDRRSPAAAQEAP